MLLSSAVAGCARTKQEDNCFGRNTLNFDQKYKYRPKVSALFHPRTQLPLSRYISFSRDAFKLRNVSNVMTCGFEVAAEKELARAEKEWSNCARPSAIASIQLTWEVPQDSPQQFYQAVRDACKIENTVWGLEAIVRYPINYDPPAVIRLEPYHAPALPDTPGIQLKTPQKKR
jgi:hypothetical protein